MGRDDRKGSVNEAFQTEQAKPSGAQITDVVRRTKVQSLIARRRIAETLDLVQQQEHQGQQRQPCNGGLWRLPRQN